MKHTLTVPLIVAFCLISSAATSPVFAYGSSGSSRCKPPTFSRQSPAAGSVVTPGAPFSLVVTKARPSSITVTVKRTPVDVSVTEKSKGQWRVDGRLPPSLKNTHARIQVSAKTESGCSASDGWLIQVGGDSE